VDGTLTRSDIFTDLVKFRRAMHPDAVWHATWPARGAFLLLLDRFSRVAVNRVTYSWYRDLRPDTLTAWAATFQAGPGLERFRPRAAGLLMRHLALGHRVIFVTGALEEIVRPLPGLLAERFHEPKFHDVVVEAVRLVERDGRFTGEIDGPPLGGDEKVRRVRDAAQRLGIDLARSFAYGDSIADLPMLEAVGLPAAVAPDLRLRRLARRRGWPVLDLDADDSRSPD
jgi:HAD superfamily hydrolase (TIGR01490 family)